jgi:CysZ protein
VEFVAGLACAFRGLVRLIVTPVLWGWAIAPVAVSAILLTAAGWAGYTTLHERVRSWAEDTFGGSVTTSIAFGLLFWSVFAALAFLAFACVVRVVASPFLVLLAERTVCGISGAPAPRGPGSPLARWVLRPVGEALLALGIRVAVLHLALPLLFVPGVGAFIFTLVLMGLLGVDLLDIAQSARGVVVAERLRFVVNHLGACFGLGIGAGLLLLVPCVNVLMLPAIVVAGVLLDSRIAPDFPKAATA